MKRPRRAAFTPLHPPNCERPPIFPVATEHRTLKRHKCRAPQSQRSLVAELEAERALVEANRELRYIASRLAARFEQKLQTKLAEIWGAPA